MGAAVPMRLKIGTHVVWLGNWLSHPPAGWKQTGTHTHKCYRGAPCEFREPPSPWHLYGGQQSRGMGLDVAELLLQQTETLTCVLSVLWDSKYPHRLSQLLSGVLFPVAKSILMNTKGKYGQCSSISVFGWGFFCFFSLQCFKFKAWNRCIFQGVQRYPSAEHKLNITFNNGFSTYHFFLPSFGAANKHQILWNYFYQRTESLWL